MEFPALFPEAWAGGSSSQVRDVLCPELRAVLRSVLCRAKLSAKTPEHHGLSHCTELHSGHLPILALLKKSGSVSFCGDLNRDEKILVLFGQILLHNLFPLHVSAFG